jgi:hypothetical protein
MEKKYSKTATQSLEDYMNGCRTIRLVCCSCLATATFMGLVFFPLWSMISKPYIGFIPEYLFMAITGFVLTQILMLSAWREINRGRIAVK